MSPLAGLEKPENRYVAIGGMDSVGVGTSSELPNLTYLSLAMTKTQQ